MLSTVKEFHKIRLLIIGSGLGKTQLIRRFVGENFIHNSLSTIGIDFKVKNIQLDGKRIKLQIWDSNSSQCESFISITRSYYRGIQGFLLVYDVTDRNSFRDIDKWLTDIQKHCDDSNVNIILIGSKCDLTKRRVVSTEEGAELAKKHNFRFFETSAAEDINVEEPFMALAEDCYKRLPKVEELHSPTNKQSNSILSTFTCLFLPRQAGERERTSREAREREARQLEERSLREVEERSRREAEERSLGEAEERSARKAEDRSTRERSASSIRERAAKAAEDIQMVERRKYGEASASPGGDVFRNSSNEAPEEYPIFEVMNEPVICADGFSYERSAIELCLITHHQKLIYHYGIEM